MDKNTQYMPKMNQNQTESEWVRNLCRVLNALWHVVRHNHGKSSPTNTFSSAIISVYVTSRVCQLTSFCSAWFDQSFCQSRSTWLTCLSASMCVCVWERYSLNPYSHCYSDHGHRSGKGCAHRSAPKCSDWLKLLNEFLLIQLDRRGQMCTDKNNSGKNRWQNIQADGNLTVKILSLTHTHPLSHLPFSSPLCVWLAFVSVRSENFGLGAW